LDGGGTRGVLTIAYLKAIQARIQALNPASRIPHPHEMFDIICGTSTGGIIAMLLGAQCRSIADTEYLYDDFIGKIFSSKSSLKLVTEQAAYDERAFEQILYQMAGNMLLLDSNIYDCSRVFCVSTMVNSNPPQTKVWRNYNYPPGQHSRYPGKQEGVEEGAQ
jgi:patatin-like phospholipase/acyl hydrolase